MSEPIDFYGVAWPREAPDRAVEAVRTLLLRRSQAGLKKYGCSTDRTDLSLADWLRHSLEEKLDDAVYMQRALMELERRINADDLRQLADDWLDAVKADQDEAATVADEVLKERLTGAYQARRNCAWELQRLLRRMDKENPPVGGSLASHTDNESA